MNYTSIQDIDSSKWVKAAIKIKSNPLKKKKLGKNKTLDVIIPEFKNAIKYTKAALNLGHECHGNEFYQ
jgi:N-succinyl-L-ornithine transcarbamylase